MADVNTVTLVTGDVYTVGSVTSPVEYSLSASSGVAGPTGFTGSSGLGFTGSAGIGFTGSSGPQGVQGAIGAPGPQGPQGVQGSQGRQGAQGIQGATGSFGGASFSYYFSANTTNLDPGVGNLKFNNTDVTIANELYIAFSDFLGANNYNYLQTIDDSTSNVKGTFKLVDTANSLNYAYFSIIGNHTHLSNYFTVPIAWLNGVSSFANNVYTTITFTRTGDKGDTGAQGFTGSAGAQGPQGTAGTQGLNGFTGSAGAQGAPGAQGTAGTQGLNGFTGSAGSQGIQGAIGFTGSAGPQGVQGAVGSQGLTGFVGSQGLQGRQGVQGAAGAQGAQGVQGASGPGADQSLNTTSAVTFANVTTSSITGTSSNTTVTANTKTWTFTYDGNILFPDLSTQTTAFSKLQALQTVSANTTANSSIDIIFVDTNLAGANVQITLPTSASNGKLYTVKNINAGGFSAIVTADAASRIEDLTGAFTTSFALSASGDFNIWVCDNGYYRRVG